MENHVIVAVTPGSVSPDPVGLADTVMNANMDVREVEPSGVGARERRRVLPVVCITPAMAEGTVSVAPAGGAKRATAA